MPLPIDAPISNVWLDVTTLKTWSLQRIGIPRTVRQIVSEWMREGYGNLRFCQFLPEVGGYVEVLAKDALLPPIQEASCPSLERRLLRAAKPRLRQMTGPFRKFLPARLDSRLRRLIYRGVEIGRRIRAKARLYATGLNRSSKAGPPLLSWSREDVLIVLGANWDIPNSSEVIWCLKRDMGFRMACMIYDMIPFMAPQFCASHVRNTATRWQTNSVWSSELVLTISEHSRRDLQNFCQLAEVPCPPVEVVRLGEDLRTPKIAAAEDPVTGLGPEEPFVLCVGTVEARKNHLLLYHVWRRLAEEHGNVLPRLVIAGAHGWLVDDLLHMLRVDPAAQAKILLLSDLNDSQLDWLYRHCLFTMYPSFYEGWGLPVAESLNYGKYCIASNSSSIPEVGADLVDLHDPCDWKECSRLVRRAVLDPEFLAARESEIRARYQRTSWHDCATRVRRHIEKHFGPIFIGKEERDAPTTGPSAGNLPDQGACWRRSA